MAVAPRPILEVRDLRTYFFPEEGTVKAVDGAHFDVYPQKTLGIVGESGCGKSVTARSILRIVERPGRIVSGSILLRREGEGEGIDLTRLDPDGREMRRIRGEDVAIILITHNLGVVAEMCDEVAVMYLGRVVEQGPVDAIFHEPKHPYTRALLRSMPSIKARVRSRLPVIEGSIPHPYNRPEGCAFHPRCPDFMPGRCDQEEPAPRLVGTAQEAACLLYPEAAPAR